MQPSEWHFALDNSCLGILETSFFSEMDKELSLSSEQPVMSSRKMEMGIYLYVQGRCH